MSVAGSYDAVVIGGGIMGCATAIRLAEGGMRVLVLERGDICQGASGVNAGTLSLQIKRVKLMPYALRGYREWQRMGEAVGFCRTGGYTLAFNQREADLLHERMEMKRQAGAPISFISIGELAAREPNLAPTVVAASYCAEDGYANSSLTGQFFRKRMQEAGVEWQERAEVTTIERIGAGFVVATQNRQARGARLLLACGGWLKGAAGLLGVDLPVRARVNTVSVTERAPPLISGVVGHATGLLTMKQKANGTILIGGGWQGVGTPHEGRGHVALATLVPNLQLARYAVPALSAQRIVRSWTGFEANVPDFYPLAGQLPGIEDAFVLGCVRGGFTIGPYIGRLMGDLLLGRTPELPLFDPARDFSTE